MQVIAEDSDILQGRGEYSVIFYSSSAVLSSILNGRAGFNNHSVSISFLVNNYLKFRTITGMKWYHTMQAVLKKDIQLELRSKYALNTVLAFVAGSMLIVLFSLRAEELPLSARGGLIWIIILFASLSVLGRSFISETERGTFDLLRLHGEPSAVYTGKLIFNFLFTLLVTVISVLIYLFMLNITVYHLWLLVYILFFGTLGLSGVSTMLGAVVSQASQKGTIYSVLSLPLLVPLILLLVRTTESAFSEVTAAGLTDDLLAMAGFAGVVISISVILFDFIWEE